MLRDDLGALGKYTGALWKHWKTLVSGVGSILLGAVSAYLKIPLPYWSLWVVAFGFFFVASFFVWRDERQLRQAVEAEADRLRAPRFSADRLRLVREELKKLDQPWQKGLLRELLLRGQMDEARASSILKDLGFNLSGALNGLQFRTSFVIRDFVGQYSISPELREAFLAALDEQ